MIIETLSACRFREAALLEWGEKTGCNQETGEVDLGVERCECYMEVKRRNTEGSALPLQPEDTGHSSD